jgi:predicted Fe-S protein YdhL (DUF1289 family)
METRNYDFDADILSDLHKDAYGFRPRSEEFWNAWDSADDDGKQRIWDRILDDLDRALETEREIQQEAIAEFNRRVSHYTSVVLNSTREDAIRVMHDLYMTNGNVESLEYELGVPFGYISKKNWG